MRVTVGIEVTGTRLDEVSVWDEQAMAAVAAWSVTTIVRRTTEQGVGADGEPFKPYSTTKTWIGLKSDTARRLKPKGGTPSRTGNSIRYDKGYAEYKKSSRKGDIASAEVDLTLSGQLMRSVDAVELAAERAVVSVRGQAREYGIYVNAKRPFIGHHKKELESLDAVINEQLDRLLGAEGK